MALRVSVCNSCGTKTDSIHNYSVDGYIEEGKTLYDKGQYYNAAASFRNALQILKRCRGCSSCKESVQAALDLCE